MYKFRPPGKPEIKRVRTDPYDLIGRSGHPTHRETQRQRLQSPLLAKALLWGFFPVISCHEEAAKAAAILTPALLSAWKDRLRRVDKEQLITPSNPPQRSRQGIRVSSYFTLLSDIKPSVVISLLSQIRAKSRAITAYRARNHTPDLKSSGRCP